MKKNQLKLTSLILCIFIAISSVSLVSCYDKRPAETTAPQIAETTPGTEITNIGSDATPTPESSSQQASPESSSQAPSDTGSAPESESDILPEESSDIPEAATKPESDPETMTDTTPDKNPDTEIGNSQPAITDVSMAAAQGLRSSVSIFCVFNDGAGGSAGSGVIYKLDAESGSAFIITNYHVVYNRSADTPNHISDDISVLLFGLEYADYIIPATYVGGSANYDIAILRVDNSELLKKSAENGSVRAVDIADSDLVAAGQTAIAIGNPEASGISVTTGIVSVDSEQITMSSINGLGSVDMRVIRIDTAVNSGNSGGGMFNSKGELTGIVNAKIKSSDVENIGYAIPSNVARAIADNIIDYCYGKECETVMRGLLGITITVDSVSTAYDPEKGMIVITQSIKVYEVSEGGLAENILCPDDIIVSLSINGRHVSVTRQHHLIDAMLDVRVGDTVEMTILRNGEESTVSTTITEDCLVAY